MSLWYPKKPYIAGNSGFINMSSYLGFQGEATHKHVGKVQKQEGEAEVKFLEWSHTS